MASLLRWNSATMEASQMSATVMFQVCHCTQRVLRSLVLGQVTTQCHRPALLAMRSSEAFPPMASLMPGPLVLGLDMTRKCPALTAKRSVPCPHTASGASLDPQVCSMDAACHPLLSFHWRLLLRGAALRAYRAVDQLHESTESLFSTVASTHVLE